MRPRDEDQWWACQIITAARTNRGKIRANCPEFWSRGSSGFQYLLYVLGFAMFGCIFLQIQLQIRESKVFFQKLFGLAFMKSELITQMGIIKLLLLLCPQILDYLQNRKNTGEKRHFIHKQVGKCDMHTQNSILIILL